MLKMGFATQWVERIMDCLSTATFSILWHGEQVGHIIPQRGLRQGCPLSPFLFLLCAEGFTSLLKRAESNDMIHGVRTASQAPSISHLFFADDNFLFLDATKEECQQVKDIFKIYEEASGQQVKDIVECKCGGYREADG